MVSKGIREYPDENICIVATCSIRAIPQIQAPLCAEHAKRVWVEIGEHFGLNVLKEDNLCNDPRHTAQRSRFAANSIYSPHGLVYIIQMGNRIKIGFTRNLAKRMKAVPNEKILATFPGTMEDEAALHERFARFRTVGEWFVADAEIIAYANERGVMRKQKDGTESKANKDWASGKVMNISRFKTDARVTAAEATLILPITKAQITTWMSRGFLDPVGKRPHVGGEIGKRPYVFNLAHLHRLHRLSTTAGARLTNISKEEETTAA